MFFIWLFIYSLLNLFLFLFVKNRILRFLAKGPISWLSIILGSLIVPIIQGGLWILSKSDNAEDMIALILHTGFAIMFIVSLLMSYFPQNSSTSKQQNNALKSIAKCIIGSVLVCILYIIALPLFWIPVFAFYLLDFYFK